MNQTTTAQIGKLFVSLSAVMTGLRDGSLTARDLRGGLFYLGCTRDSLFARGHRQDRAIGERSIIADLFDDDPEWGNALYRLMLDAVELAEREGRVAWRSSWGNANSVAHLNVLFQDNGILPIDDSATGQGMRFYSQLIGLKESCFPLDVVI